MLTIIVIFLQMILIEKYFYHEHFSIKFKHKIRSVFENYVGNLV